MIRLLVLLLTALTGFSALVYEVTWQRYLATLLGSHSEATAAVLAIFLGGMAVGYEAFGRVTRVERPTSAYLETRSYTLPGSAAPGENVLETRIIRSGFSDLVERQGKPEGYCTSGVLQTGEVLLEKKELPPIRAHGLIDPIAVKETVVEN